PDFPDASRPDLTLYVTKIDPRAGGQSDAPARRDVFHFTFAVGGGPGLRRKVLQSPNRRICRMAGYRSDRLGKIVSAIFVHMVRKERSVMIQHHDVPAQTDAGRQAQLLLA